LLNASGDTGQAPDVRRTNTRCRRRGVSSPDFRIFAQPSADQRVYAMPAAALLPFTNGNGRDAGKI
jgi:hypothetical protein